MANEAYLALTTSGLDMPDEFNEFRMMVFFHCLDREVIKRMPEVQYRRILDFMQTERDAGRIAGIDPSASP